MQVSSHIYLLKNRSTMRFKLCGWERRPEGKQQKASKIAGRRSRTTAKQRGSRPPINLLVFYCSPSAIVCEDAAEVSKTKEAEKENIYPSEYKLYKVDNEVVL